MGIHLFRLKHGDGAYNDKKHIGITRAVSPSLLIFSCFFLYTAMMAAKGVFLAEITYIMKIFDVDKATASLTNTYYFVAYAGMQVLLFFFVKKLDLRKFLAVTVPIAAIATMLMGFSESIVHMWILFAISGLFQAGVYSGTNHTLTKYLPSSYLSRANKVMNLGYATGTVIAYAVSAVFVRFDLWSWPFYILGAVFLVSVIVYAICSLSYTNEGATRKATPSEKNAEQISPTLREERKDLLFTVDTKKQKLLFYSIDLVLTFLVTALYYAIMNWITTLLVEVHSLPQDISIYVTILAPSLIALGPMMTIRSCDKHRDFIAVGIKYLCFVLPIPLLLSFIYDLNIIVSFILSVLFVIGVNGVKAIALSILTFKMRSVINSAEYSCISNAVASLAGGVVPTVIGKIIDSAGWSVSYLVVFGLTLALIVSLVIIDAVLKKHGEKPCNADKM